MDHVLVVSLYRVNADIPPPSVSLLSASSTPLRIAPLDDEGVDRLIGACLRPRVDDITVLTSLLSCETAGNPLYLRTILADLVQEGVLYFDFDILSWRYDLLQVQSRLSDSGVDAYIKYTLTRLSPEVKETLAVSIGFVAGLTARSCLPFRSPDFASISLPQYSIVLPLKSASD